MNLSITVDARQLQRQVDEAVKRQLPYATARALTAVARKGADAERDAMRKDLDRPRPFTEKGVVALGANKTNLTSTVLLRPIQSSYLAPNIEGGPQVLGSKRAILDPVNVALNQYGNLPRNLIARLRGRTDIFIGAVKGVHGVWQRVAAVKPRFIGRRGLYKAGQPAHLKLLIRFADPKQLPERYPFGDATIDIAQRDFGGELQRALDQALTTAR